MNTSTTIDNPPATRLLAGVVIFLVGLAAFMSLHEIGQWLPGDANIRMAVFISIVIVMGVGIFLAYRPFLYAVRDLSARKWVPCCLAHWIAFVVTVALVGGGLFSSATEFLDGLLMKAVKDPLLKHSWLITRGESPIHYWFSEAALFVIAVIFCLFIFRLLRLLASARWLDKSGGGGR